MVTKPAVHSIKGDIKINSMKKLAALFLIAAFVGCNTEKKETVDYAELLKIKESIEKGSGYAIRRYQEMIDGSQLENIEADPKFIELKNQALADVNDLIAQALENGVDKDELVDCIKKNGADSPSCEQYVQQVKTNTSPRMKQFDADLGKFIANHLNENNHLPKLSGKSDCNAIHNGSFQVVIEADTMTISRDQNFQIEQFRGDTRKQKVTWINDCTYRLELIKEESQTSEESKASDESLTIDKDAGGFLEDSFVEIIRVTGDYYMYKIFDTANDEVGQLVDVGKVYITK